jgi:hypothetical protein
MKLRAPMWFASAAGIDQTENLMTDAALALLVIS